MFVCCECEQSYEAVEELHIHATVEHVAWVPYQCFLCKYVYMPTEATLREHYRLHHSGRNVKVLFNTNKQREAELEVIMRRCMENGTNDERLITANPSSSTPLFDENTSDLESSSGCMKRHRKESPSNLRPSSRISMAKQSKTVNNTNSWRPLLYCHVCERQLASADTGSANMHIWNHHLLKPVIECKICGFAFTHRSPEKIRACKRHILLDHQIDADADESAGVLVDNHDKLLNEYQQLKQKCFPADASGKHHGLINLEQQLAVERADGCSKCQRKTIAKGTRYDHVYWHLKEDYAMSRLKCLVGDCTYSSHIYVAIAAHLQGFHKLTPTDYRKYTEDLTEELDEQFLECLSICFPRDLPKMSEPVPPVEERSKLPLSHTDTESTVFQANPSNIQINKSSTVVSNAMTKKRPQSNQLAYCNLCDTQLGISLASSSALAGHVWMHHVNKPVLVCNFCPYSSKQPTQLSAIRNHIRGVHPEENPNNGYTNRRGSLMTEFEDYRRRCFISDRKGEILGCSTAVQLAVQRSTHCAKCGHCVDKTSKFDHVYMHLRENGVARYNCVVEDCQYTTHKFSIIATHVRTFHKLSVTNSHYANRSKLIEADFATMTEECFPVSLS